MPKLALIKATSHEGPWIRPVGNEIGVKVYPPLQATEVVLMTIVTKDSHAEHDVPSGFTEFPLAKCKKFKVRKIGDETRTSVEII